MRETRKGDFEVTLFEVSTNLFSIDLSRDWNATTIDILSRDATLRLQKFFGQEGVYKIDREMGTWVTIPGEWLTKKEAFEGLDSVAAHMRMLQMYGLSPDCTYNIMVQFYADVKGIFRPASDPSIDTTSAGIEFPEWADENYKVGDTNFREWFRYNVSAAFEDDSPLPWTRLGYTYDWHKGAPRQGLSEYVVVDQTYLKVKSYESEWQFIQNLSK